MTLAHLLVCARPVQGSAYLIPVRNEVEQPSPGALGSGCVWVSQFTDQPLTPPPGCHSGCHRASHSDHAARATGRGSGDLCPRPIRSHLQAAPTPSRRSSRRHDPIPTLCSPKDEGAMTHRTRLPVESNDQHIAPRPYAKKSSESSYVSANVLPWCLHNRWFS